EVLEEVEREPLAGEERARLAVERREHVARLGLRAFPCLDRDAHAAERAEDAMEKRQAADNETLLRVKCGAGARANRHERFSSPVATADVLLDREVDERRDAGIVPEGICRGIRRSGLQRTQPLEAAAERRAPLLELRALGADLVHDVLRSLLGELRIPELRRRGAELPLHLRELALEPAQLAADVVDEAGERHVELDAVERLDGGGP